MTLLLEATALLVLVLYGGYYVWRMKYWWDAVDHARDWYPKLTNDERAYLMGRCYNNFDQCFLKAAASAVGFLTILSA